MFSITAGGAQNPFATWDVFKDIQSPPYSFMEGGEIFKRLGSIPPLAEKALELIGKCKDKVSRNNIAVDFLRLAAMRFRHAARQFLLVEEAKRNYREAWRAQYPMWFPEGLRSARPKEVERKIEKTVELLKEVYEEIGPIKEEVRRLWLWHRKTYRLKDWFMDYYDAQEADLLEKTERLQGFLKIYREQGAGVFPWPDRMDIWQNAEGSRRKRKIFAAWGF